MFLVSSVIPMDVAKSETLNTSDSFLPPKKRMRLDEPPTDNALVSTAIDKVSFSNNTKYKGVVQHQNGHWGAQIYVDHKRIWLGTFKSAAEAAMGYDSASIKLRSFDTNSYRNFPWSDLTVHEPVFQKGYTTEAVLNMIKDGSYQREFQDFLKNRSQVVVGSKQNRRGEESNKCFSCTQLFQKELTASDVGKLNRLVIPKKYAVKYLPFISEREEGEIVEDVEVVFYDREMRSWTFKYCYWTSSQSFVFTRGWIAFVKEKSLKEKDVITFYTCDVPTLEGQSKNFLMVDVHRFSDSDSVVTDEEVNKTVHNSSDDVISKPDNFSKSKLGEEETKPEENKGGFMLFGVRIQ
ncbi:AP2/ERF and B3 domain-containing transcription factor At1g50680-like [Raphanus sativus]|uniref:AP2/ERF and B3 domain-containing transcription factor At1g50680-like n=1 Tax=Raphanus sativus TaxID=3726 RepID=A0A9W3BYI1_RAPSA|nr:AP2/ERF and B3 domain-containing transcription factor At1g50680-like [Raphanus sativus]